MAENAVSELFFKTLLVEEKLKYYNVMLWHGNQS